MGTQPKPARDGSLARQLKDEALVSIAESGPGALSMRALSRSIGVSHGAHAKHFADKSDIFAALAVEGFELIAERFSEVRKSEGPNDDAIQRLHRSALGFVEWAEAHRGYYLAMWQPDLHGHDHRVRDAQAIVHRAWTSLIEEAQIAGLGASIPLSHLVDTLWAALIGLAAQTVHGMLPSGSNPAPAVISTLMTQLR